MYTWTRGMAVAATLLAGCSAKIDDPGATSPGAGAPGSAGTGAGATTSVPGGGASPGAGSGSTSGGSGNATAGGGSVTPVACVPGVAQTSQLPRLTRAQYDNTARDLLGIDAQPSTLLAPDTVGSVDQRAWDGYQAAADALATQVMANATAKTKVIGCTPTGDGAACARQLIETFGRRAFRRPLTPAEITRFETLYTTRAQITEKGTFDEAARVIIKALLLSPSFLTRAEIAEVPEGSNFVLNGYEVASRLSYMLWGSMPDEALFTAAAGGVLANAAGILTQAQRLLADPKARAKVGEFHQQYAHMGEGTRWAQINRDPAVYPKFNAAMTPLLSDETKRFFDSIVFEKGGTFRDLLTSPLGFVNATLAPLYGLDPAKYGAELQQVSLDPATRPGIFTRAGFLTSYSLYNRPSPILRGAFLQKEVLCMSIGAPPPGVEATPLPTTGKTNRERVDAQTADAACAGCHHTLINPTGFALEAYDAIGSYQQTDGGQAIDTKANVIMGQTVVPVTGASDLMTQIANSPAAQRCYAQKWVQYAYERLPTNEDACTVDSLAGKLTQDGYTVVNLITDLTQSQSFRYRAKVSP